MIVFVMASLSLNVAVSVVHLSKHPPDCEYTWCAGRAPPPQLPPHLPYT